ncbi:MAG: hypothetical protein IT373_35820 [Polyangiaceae bacterium]|nr:hypothetical protein [Polyangiaceae bacterium]
MLARWTWLIALAGCGDLIPARPSETGVHDAATSPLDALDADIPEGVACERDEDCAPYAGCCLDPLCRDGVCLPFYVPACCTGPGPCATASTFHSGTCGEACVANGCEEAWSPPPGSCAEVLSAATFDAAGLPALSLSDPDPNDRIAWAPSATRTFAGQPALHAGDVVCPTYYAGPLGGDCRPIDPSADAGPVRLALSGPWVALPADRPAVAEVWLWLDVGAGHVDGVALDVTPESFGPVLAWDSRVRDAPRATWFPVLLDLSLWAGQRVRIGATFDTLDGRDNDHEGAYLGALAIRTLCADDRACPAAAACAVGRQVALTPLADTACVLAPADPGPACVPCQDAAACPLDDACDVATCTLGVCHLERVLDAACCTPDVTWPGDGSFEAALEPGWEAEPGWAVSVVRSLVGEGALHFGLTDGSAIAPPGERASGAIWSPAFDMPRDAPVLSFALFLATEWDAAPSRTNPAGLDRLEVLVRPDAPGAAAATVWSSTAIGGTTGGQWLRVRVALDGWAGRRARVGLRFDTGDEHDNAHEGVFIDDARIFRACPGCGPEQVDDGCDPGPVTRARGL